MKKLFVCAFVIMMVMSCAVSAFAASYADGVVTQGSDVKDAASSGATYSVVSAVANKTYDFQEDFHDSYPYDENFYTEGVFELDDYMGDVTITLKNNGTGEEFVYEEQSGAEWSVKASIDYLLYETTQLDAVVHIYDLGGDYGISEEDIPVQITVTSSLYEADFHKYPSYEGANAFMEEGTDFTVDYDASSSEHQAKITLLTEPRLLSLCLYNVETGQKEYFDTDADKFEFDTEIEIIGFDPSKKAFWFVLPGRLVMEDGYVFDFSLTVEARLKNSAAEDGSENPATDDSAKKDSSSDVTEDDAIKADATKDTAATADAAQKSDSNNVKTGEPMEAYVLAVVLLLTAAVLGLFSTRRRRVR